MRAISYPSHWDIDIAMTESSSLPAGEEGGKRAGSGWASRLAAGVPARGLLARSRQILSGRIAIALGWTASAMIAGQIIRLAGTLIMTRLLVPDVFGVMAIVMSVQVTLALFLDIGIRAAVIQSPQGDDPDFLNTAWTMQVIRGFVIWTLIALLAVSIPHLTAAGYIPAGSAWAAPELPLVLAAASFAAVIDGFASTNALTAERNLQLKRVVQIRLIGQASGLVIMVSFGLALGSIWAFVASGLLGTLIETVLTHRILPGIRNRFAWNAKARSELARFGVWILISSVTFILATNLDRLVLGGLVDPATLGLYAIALNLALILQMLAFALIGSVALPALSEAARDNPDQFRRKYFRLRLPLDLGLLSAAGALYVLAPLIVNVMYDDRYSPAGEMLQILGLSLVLARYNLNITSYIAMGRPKLQAFANCARFASMAVMLIAGYRFYGFDGALYAISLHMIPVLPLIFWFNRALNLNSVKYELLVLPAFPAGYAAGLILLDLYEYIRASFA